MPEINRFACDHCDFRLPTGWGGYCYVTTAGGERVTCPHPGEPYTIMEVTGLNLADAMAAGRVGHNSHCVCPDCLEQFDLDLERDECRCPACSSAAVCSTWESVDRPCPKCKEGMVRRGSPIVWPLDANRSSLPVPQVVKDLVEYEKRRQSLPSLQPAYDEVGRVPGTDSHDFWVICVHLLKWWEGDYFARGDKEPKDSSKEYDDKWPWVRAFKSVVRAVPELDAMIEWCVNRFRFKAGVSPELRRGIKNYLREHREHVVES